MKPSYLAAALMLAACVSSRGGLDAAPSEIACPEHNLAGEVRCVTIDVAENLERPNGRRIALEVMILAARSGQPERDPLFVIPGGPGQSATRSAGVRAYFAEVFDAVRETRDVVLFAPRGTAGSHELALNPPNELLFASLDAVLPPEWVDAARARLEMQADLAQYTTANIVADIEATRRSLGYERVNVYATSYGTRVAQLYAARHGDRVRAMILKAPLPPDAVAPLTYTSGAERSLRLVFERCAAQAACAAAHPNMAQRFDALMTRLRAEPQRVSVTHPITNAPVELVINDTAFGYLLRNLLMSASGARLALDVIESASGGDFAQAGALTATMRRAYALDLAGGMSLSVIATEDVPQIAPADLEADRVAGFLRGAVADRLIEATANWPRGAAPRDLYQPLRSDIPTLLVAGELDPATPPEFAYRTAATLTRARVLVFPGGSHSANNFTGLAEIMYAFVETADPQAIDISAVAANRPLPLVAEEN
jgi:pimeloyl-ACP methyl ester carboxylesterase